MRGMVMHEWLLDIGPMAAIAATALALVICVNSLQRRRTHWRRQRKLSAAFSRAQSFRTQGVSMLTSSLES